MVVITHFDKYPLITKKRADYVLFKQILELMNKKEHRTIEGVKKVVSLKHSMNKGLSNKIKLDFPDIVPAIRPLVPVAYIKDGYWVAGFASGEGSFVVRIYNSKTHNCGKGVRLLFAITQSKRDIVLLNKLIILFQYGRVSNQLTPSFRVENFKDIIEKIIPFFEQYPIEGVKALDFLIFKEVAQLIKEKKHLTKEGIITINTLRLKMYSRRSSIIID